MRNTIFLYFRFLAIVFLGMLWGCWLTQQDGNGASPVPAELLIKGVNGSRTSDHASATWITHRIALEQVYFALNKRQLNGGYTPPDIDFETYGVLLLEMGQKPTGGYTMDFDPSSARVMDKQAVIKIFWHTPNEGAFVTQAVTSPFMLIKIYRTGIVSIRVIDQDGQPLFEIPVR